MLERFKSACVFVDDDKVRNQICRILVSEKFRVTNSKTLAAAERASETADIVFGDDQLLSEAGSRFCLEKRGLSPEAKFFFVSKDWCGEEDFVWLRDIVGVSTQFIEPINEKVIVAGIRAALMSEEKLQTVLPVDETRSTKGGGERLVDDPDSMALIAIQEQLRERVVEEWKYFRSMVDDEAHGDRSLAEFEPLIKIAHKLRGSAGSLNLIQLSKCAGRIEDWLKMFRLRGNEHRDILVSAIRDQISSGDRSLELLEPIVQIGQGRSFDDDGDRAAPLVVLGVGDNDEQLSEIEMLLADVASEFFGLSVPVKLLDEVELLKPNLIILHSGMSSVSVVDACAKICSNLHSLETAAACFITEQSHTFDISDLPGEVSCIQKFSDGAGITDLQGYLSRIRSRGLRREDDGDSSESKYT